MANSILSGNNANESGNKNNSKTLVLLHYFGGSADSWQWVTRELKDDYFIVAINLPGFGGTAPLEKPSIKAFADRVQNELAELQITNYVLIGHSMGGKIAMQLAADAPAGQVEHLILLAPSPPTFEDVPQQEKEQMLIHPSAEMATANIKKNTVQPLSTDAYELAVDTNYMVDENTWRWWINEGMNHSIADYLTRLQMPITVISSKDDAAITTKSIKQEVMPHLPNAKLMETEGIGHLYPLESPVWVAEMIRQVVR